MWWVAPSPLGCWDRHFCMKTWIGSGDAHSMGTLHAPESKMLLHCSPAQGEPWASVTAEQRCAYVSAVRWTGSVARSPYCASNSERQKSQSYRKTVNTHTQNRSLFYFFDLNFLGEENSPVNRDLKWAFVATFRRAKNSNQTTFNNTLLPEENKIGAATIK